MQFFIDKINISFDEFSLIFPKESEILKSHFEFKGSFLITKDKKVISLKYGDFNPIFINIAETLSRHAVYFYKNSFYKDPLAKAIGLKKGKSKPRVLDATGGMLADSLLIYAYGVKSLVCYERNPIIAVLGLNAINNSSVNIDYRYGEFLSEIDGAEFDVIYYDPMYQIKNTKTAAKKEMEIFRDLVGVDEDIMDTAMGLKKLAKERLVIKRSNKAQPILEGQTHTIRGKSTSYDVYL